MADDDTRPELPGAPGLYRDRDGDPWVCNPDGVWFYLGSGGASRNGGARGYGPMVPWPWPEPDGTEPADAFAEAVQSAGFLAADVARIGGARISVTISEAGSTGRTANVEVAP